MNPDKAKENLIIYRKIQNLTTQRNELNAQIAALHKEFIAANPEPPRMEDWASDEPTPPKP